ncbi:hypothetical protein LCGC14_0854900 [marine sediment metagenome]|uniref:Uncharacterized protein n=1 Tax=marine sediment metagenome TaxID=412755 RepID=A0A0F9PE05_9ZZZZ
MEKILINEKQFNSFRKLVNFKFTKKIEIGSEHIIHGRMGNYIEINGCYLYFLDVDGTLQDFT